MTLSQTATIQVDGLGLYGPLNACQLKAPFREHCLELTEKAEDENHRSSHVYSFSKINSSSFRVVDFAERVTMRASMILIFSLLGEF